MPSNYTGKRRNIEKGAGGSGKFGYPNPNPNPNPFHCFMGRAATRNFARNVLRFKVFILI